MKNWHKFIIKTLVITGLAMIFNYSIFPGMIDLSSVLTQKNTEGFQMSDFYNRVAANYAAKELNDNVVCVNFEYDNRDTLSTLFNILADKYKPKAVGVDFYFPVEGDNDAQLIHSLKKFGDKLVMPQIICSYFIEETGEELFAEDYSTYFNDSLNDAKFGVINLETNYTLDVIRDFKPYFPTVFEDTLFNFAVQLAKIAEPSSISLINEQLDYEGVLAIKFPFVWLDTISAVEFLRYPDEWHDLIDGRVVIVGSNNDLKDIYQTSLPEPIAGMQVHAYTVNTIMSGEYIKRANETLMMWFSIVIVFFIVLLNCFASEYAGSAGNSVMRIVQFLVIIICLIVGYAVFNHYLYYLNFGYTITLIVMSMLAYDVVGVFEWFYEIYKKKNIKIK